MSTKRETKLLDRVSQDLDKHNYQILNTYKDITRFDLLAFKNNCLFAIEVKSRPIETFDIVTGSTINSSTLSNLIRDKPEYQDKEVIPVLVSGSVVLGETKEFGSRMGVIVTETSDLAESLENSICYRKRKS